MLKPTVAVLFAGLLVMIIPWCLVLGNSEPVDYRVPHFSVEEMEAISSQSERLERRIAGIQAVQRATKRAASDLVGGKGLRAVTAEVHATAVQRDPRHLECLGMSFPGTSERERVALNLIEYLRQEIEIGNVESHFGGLAQQLENEARSAAFQEWCAKGTPLAQTDG
jgi:hypothetical protein